MSTSRSRWLLVPPLALALAIAMAGCDDEEDVVPTPAPLTDRLELRDEMRDVWLNHVLWTRVYLIAAVGGLPDTEIAGARLFENQDDIANAIRPFYGDAAANQLNALLDEHIALAAEIVAASITFEDQVRINTAVDAWYANADAIARFLADANPEHWSFEDLQAMMHTHLDQLIDEAMARIQGNWAADVAAYDASVDHIAEMADVLAEGIAMQFPALVADTRISTRDESMHIASRQLWMDHVSWERFYLMSATGGLDDASYAAARLIRNGDEIAATFDAFYGAGAVDTLGSLMKDHVAGMVDVVTASQLDDPQRLDLVVVDWYATSDETSALLSSANPTLDAGDVTRTMQDHLDLTRGEITARVAGDHRLDVAFFDATTLQSTEVSDMLTTGLARQFPDPAGTPLPAADPQEDPEEPPPSGPSS